MQVNLTIKKKNLIKVQKVNALMKLREQEFPELFHGVFLIDLKSATRKKKKEILYLWRTAQ